MIAVGLRFEAGDVNGRVDDVCGAAVDFLDASSDVI